MSVRSKAGWQAADPAAILDSLWDAVIVVEEGGRIVYANLAAAQILGRPVEELVGTDARFLLQGGAPPVAGCPFTHNQPVPEESELEFELPEGRRRVKVAAGPLRDREGNIAGAVYLITETTRRRSAKRQAAEDAWRLLSLMDNVPGVVYRGLRDWSVTFIGAEVLRLTGHPPERFLSGALCYRDLIHPEDLGRVRETFRRAVAERRTILRVEYRILHADGGTRRVADRRQFFYDGEGRFAYVDGLLLDITERKEAEARLHVTTERLRALVEASPLPIIAVDLQGLVTLWNPAAERVFGWTAEEVLGRLNPVVPEERVEEFRAFLDRTVLEGGVSEVETVRRRKDGTLVAIRLSTAPLRDGDGTPVGIMGVIADVTEQKRMEQALRESEERYRRLVDASPEMIFVHCDGRIAYMNETGLSLLRAKEPADVIGMPVAELLHPASREKALSAGAAETPQNPPGALAAQKYVRLDGTVLEVEAMSVPVVYEGRPAFQVFARDVTRRREAEEALRHSQEQLRQAQKMEAVGRLAGGVAHDFNNFLTAIRGYTDLMLMRLPKNSPFRREVEEIQKAGDRAATLTQQLLAFSRKQVLKAEVVDLNGIVSNLDKMLRRLIGEDIELITVLRPGVGKVRVDPGQIEQVIMNLVVNARDAMPTGGKITIETAGVELSDDYASRHTTVRPGPHVMLAVTDTGDGMDEETKARLFEPFFTTKEKGKGTGLGLSTVYGIVKQSEGSIWVYSAPGVGTTFKIYFPRVDGEAVPARAGPEMPAAPGGRETILLVEDEEAVRALVREVLEGAGYTILEAADGEEALRVCRARGESIDLMITDLVMPRLGGRRLVERLPAGLRRMKLLYMSGYPDDAVGRHGMIDPGAPFLQKPFTVSALLRKAREVLDS